MHNRMPKHTIMLLTHKLLKLKEITHFTNATHKKHTSKADMHHNLYTYEAVRQHHHIIFQP